MFKPFDDNSDMSTANPNEPTSVFRWLWFTSGQGKLWNCDSTYCGVPYEYLPVVERATDDLAWLDQVSHQLRQVVGSATLNNSNNEIAHLETITTKFQNLEIDFPAPFLRFMRDSQLQQKVPTCTDCFLSLSEEPVQLPYTPGEYLLRFLNDSQSCVMWYLLFKPGEETRVLASGVFLEPDIFKAMEYEDLKYLDAFKEVFFCASSFTEFLYRFWIENTLWFSMQHSLDLTLLQEEYRLRITRRL